MLCDPFYVKWTEKGDLETESRLAGDENVLK